MKFFRVGVGVAVFLVLTAASCATTQPFIGNGQPKISFLGDSITVQSTDAINTRFKPDHDVRIDALVGQDTFLAAGQAASEAAEAPAVAVINLGTNDANRHGAPWVIGGVEVKPQDTVEDSISRLDTFVADFERQGTCVVVVTVNSHSWGPDWAATINAHIRQTFSQVADWDSAWSASYFAKAGDPHPNESGRQALLDLESTAVAGCATVGGTTTTTSTSTTTTTTTP